MAQPALLGPCSEAAPLFLARWFQKTLGGISSAPRNLPREICPPVLLLQGFPKTQGISSP